MSTQRPAKPDNHEQELVKRLKDNQDAAIRALDDHDMVAYRALAIEEARLMDELRAIWSTR